MEVIKCQIIGKVTRDFLVASGATVEVEVNCSSETTCNHFSHDSEYDVVILPQGVIQEALFGIGCVSDTCSCQSHPRGITGVMLFHFPDGISLSLKGALQSEDMGHFPFLRLCDAQLERIMQEKLKQGYLAFLDGMEARQ